MMLPLRMLENVFLRLLEGNFDFVHVLFFAEETLDKSGDFSGNGRRLLHARNNARAISVAVRPSPLSWRPRPVAWRPRSVRPPPPSRRGPFCPWRGSPPGPVC